MMVTVVPSFKEWVRKLYSANVSIVGVQYATFGSIKYPAISAQIYSSLAVTTILHSRALLMKMITARHISGTKPYTNYQLNIAFTIAMMIGTKNFTSGILYWDMGTIIS